MTNELSGKRIVVVEDDLSNLAVIAMKLKTRGAVVLEDPLNSTTIGLLLRVLPVDIILLDLKLRHGKSGYDIFDELQAIPELAGIPVVAVTASDPEIEIPTLRKKGFAGLIAKPINLTAFPSQVAAAIRGESVWITDHSLN